MTEREATSGPFTQLANEILNTGSCLRFKALGSSMTPFIRNGDVLTVEPCTPSDIRVGDIAFYHTPGRHMLAHRLLGKEIKHGQSFLKIRGDASTGPYEWIPPDRVLGRAIAVERRGGTLRLDTPSARIAGRLWAALQPLGYLLIRGRYRLKSLLQKR